jgi:hypothetical protein
MINEPLKMYLADRLPVEELKVAGRSITNRRN